MCILSGATCRQTKSLILGIPCRLVNQNPKVISKRATINCFPRFCFKSPVSDGHTDGASMNSRLDVVAQELASQKSRIVLKDWLLFYRDPDCGGFVQREPQDLWG